MFIAWNDGYAESVMQRDNKSPPKRARYKLWGAIPGDNLAETAKMGKQLYAKNSDYELI